MGGGDGDRVGVGQGGWWGWVGGGGGWVALFEYYRANQTKSVKPIGEKGWGKCGFGAHVGTGCSQNQEVCANQAFIFREQVASANRLFN